MSDYNISLDDILEERFNYFMEFLKREGINKKVILVTSLSPSITLPALTMLLGSIAEFLNMINNDTIYIPIPMLTTLPIIFYLLYEHKNSYAAYLPLLRIINVRVNTLESDINNISEKLVGKNINNNFLILLDVSGDNTIVYPILVRDVNDAKRTLALSFVDIILSHEISHALVGSSEIKASSLGYLMFYITRGDEKQYIEKYIPRNLLKCKEYINNNKKYDQYIIGECFANVMLNENKNINVKEKIEYIKSLKDNDIIRIVESRLTEYNIS